MKSKTSRGRNVVKAPDLGREIVVPVAGANVVVVRAAIDSEVTRSGRFTAVLVVARFIGFQDVCAVVNFSVAMQFVNVSDLFLLDSADKRPVLKFSSCARAARGDRWSAGDHFGRLLRLRFLCVLGIDQQLSGY